MVNKSVILFFNKMKYLFYLLVATAIILPVNVASAEDSKVKKDFEFLIEPYLMFANIKGDSSINFVNDADVDISSSDIFDHLKLGGMIRMEGIYKNNWGLAFDFSFMDLEKDIPGAINGIYYTSGAKQTIIELFCFNRITIDQGVLDIFVGARRWKNKLTLSRSQGALLPLISLQRDENWVDAIIGLRGIFDIAQDWQLMIRGDIGGFGLESDFTAKTAVNVMYNITDSITLDIQYMALWVDYETGTRNTANYFAYDTVTHGPAIGVIFKF
ncbi:MAG: hypothetical protein ABFR31_00850 [Thermodesulfobacteriota bacterium]